MFGTPAMVTAMLPADPVTAMAVVPLAICVTATLLATVTLLKNPPSPMM